VVNGTVKSGATVTFTLGDVVCPECRHLPNKTTPELEVCGRIVFLSDHGDQKNHFAVIDVRGILSPLIVPVSRLRMVGTLRRHDIAVG